MTTPFDPANIKQDFAVHSALDRNFWPTDDKLNPTVRKGLLIIAKMFVDSLDKPVQVKDVRLTGSVANYNYSRFSDVDLHIILDFDKLSSDRSVVEEYLALKKNQWNTTHHIKMYGHVVEVYAEDVGATHIATGLYSVLKDEWIKIPSPKQPKFDPGDVATKAVYFKNLYSVLVRRFKLKKYNAVIRSINQTKEQIRNMRQSGLKKDGEFSTENLAFKVLRRSGLLGKLTDLKNKAIDAKMTIESERNS